MYHESDDHNENGLKTYKLKAQQMYWRNLQSAVATFYLPPGGSHSKSVLLC
jgi:hypothetical protein